MSQPRKYKAEVVSVVNPVDDIYTVEMKSLTGKFKYLPGQFLHLALDEYDPSFGWPESRCFSMQSSPKNELLKITYSVKGVFTSRMSRELNEGCKVNLKLPYGGLFQNEHSKNNVVFIAGGTGITPYLSVFTDPSFSIYSSPKLYLGVRSMKYNIYQNELKQAEKINPSINICIKYQDVSGILDVDYIYHENGNDPYYFISGPQRMLSLFKNRLLTHGITEKQIITDEWE